MNQASKPTARLRATALLCAAALICGTAVVCKPTLTASAAGPSARRVDFKDTVLKNGLRVITVEDHNTPGIALAVIYNVGSRNERKGRTGFAHLFEHMMFKGSENRGAGEQFALIFRNVG